MNVFPDTNVLLGLYKLTGPDLEEVRRFIALAEHKKLTIYINDHVVDELHRNRERVIAESMKQLEVIRRGQPIPNLVRPYKAAAQLREAMAVVTKATETLQEEVVLDIEINALKADNVVDALLSKFKPQRISEAVIAKARRRRELGRPPGKPANNIGDAINWEWLLEVAPPDVQLHIISTDGDYESELHDLTPKEYLRREWFEAKGAALHLHKSLLSFLQHCFPYFKLADEVEKVIAIERFVNSFNFNATHSAVAALRQYNDFSAEELKKMLLAMEENSQISWILDDDDVKAFAEKLVAMAAASKDAKEAAIPIKDALAKMAPVLVPDDELPY